MSRIATMGTSSCGTFALSGFKDQDYKLEETYLKATEEEQDEMDKAAFDDVVTWYNNILHPTAQPLGKTDEHPFSALMNGIEKHERLSEKFLIVTLISYQLNVLGKGYWNQALKDRGFKFFHTTANSTMEGDPNYLFFRDPVALDKKPSGWG